LAPGMLWLADMRISRTSLALRIPVLAALAGLALVGGCSTKPLQDNRGDGGEADCSGVPIPAIACLVGPTESVCTFDQDGKPHWVILCPGVENGGTTGSGGSGGGAGGAGGSGPDGGVGTPCVSSESCGKGLVCTTADGVCNPPPGCGPNAACPAVCYGSCRLPDEDGAGPACGPVQCGKGQVCCNDSCGICTAPGGACTQQFCTKDPVPCNSDDDCKLEADYCTGCDCRALAAKQSLPTCSGPGVACLIDPCFNKTARCVNGGCVAQ
jgi:hypothetical protein